MMVSIAEVRRFESQLPTIQLGKLRQIQKDLMLVEKQDEQAAKLLIKVNAELISRGEKC